MKQLLLLVTMMTTSFFAAQAQQDSAKLYQKIDELFSAMNMGESFTTLANTAAEQTITNTPALVGHKEETQTFFTKYIGWPAFRTDLAKIYAKAYTNSEIDELLRFYKTSAGKKILVNNTQVQQDILTAQQQKLSAHAEELNKLVAAPKTDASGTDQ